MAEWMPRWQSYNLCKDFHDIDTLCMILFLTLFFQFALVHYFTKVGAGEYYLQELEETVCMEEERRKIKNRIKLETDDNAQQDSVRLPFIYFSLLKYSILWGKSRFKKCQISEPNIYGL